MDWIEDGQWSEKMIIDSLFSVSVHVGYGGFDNYNGFSNYCFLMEYLMTELGAIEEEVRYAR